MTDNRPLPEYGEYATPEQQAAAMGRAYTPPPAPETRVAIPVVPGASPPRQEQLRLGGNAIDRFATIFQLGIGLVFLINSNYFQFGEAFNSTSSELGLGTTLPTTIDRLGWVILVVNIVLYVATALFAYYRLRRARLAFFVPVIGVSVFYAFLFVLLSVSVRG